MKHLLAAVAISSALLATPALAASGPPYANNGPVWDYTMVKVKDGHFTEYMRWLDTEWKAQEQALVKGGYAIGYKVLIPADPRPREANLILATEYKNMAAFDTPPAVIQAFMEKQFGSLKKASEGEVARGSIRKVMGDVLVREAVLK